MLVTLVYNLDFCYMSLFEILNSAGICGGHLRQCLGYKLGSDVLRYVKKSILGTCQGSKDL